MIQKTRSATIFFHNSIINNKIEPKHLHSAKLIQHPVILHSRSKRGSPGACQLGIQISTHQVEIYYGGGCARLNKKVFNCLQKPVFACWYQI